MFLSHGYLPPKLIETTIVPIIKNKCGNISSSSNYRPIALATIISKLLESILLLKCEEYLCTSANQFGFKKAHRTELCIYTLRGHIELYRKRSTTVFVTFLDASKAFDRLDHWLLFEKLIYRKVPLFIVRLLIVWYSLQRMHIRWGNTFSTSFCVSNGVKQGGIISPVLFNVYMDDLSCELNRSNIGGRIGGEIVNHLSYADDLCLICLSSAGMQKLLNVCSKYTTKHSLSYNASKSYSLCFKATTIKFERPTLHIAQINIPLKNIYKVTEKNGGGGVTPPFLRATHSFLSACLARPHAENTVSSKNPCRYHSPRMASCLILTYYDCRRTNTSLIPPRHHYFC